MVPHVWAHGKSYTCSPFNFYVFPRQVEPRVGPDMRFSCQTSSLTFLASNGFDFNKWMLEGIPFLRSDERTQLAQKQAAQKASNSEIIELGTNKPFIDETM